MSFRYSFALLGLLVVVVACGGKDLAVIDVSDGSGGALGEEGTYGVGWAERQFRVRVDQTVETDVYVPMISTEKVADGPFPLVVGIQGGGVEPKAYRWLYEPESFSDLVLLASYPAESEDYRRRPSPEGDRVLSIIGGRDERSSNAVEKAYEGVERIRESSIFAVIEGMNHYQWGDLPSQSQLARDAAPTVDTDDARHRALSMIDDFPGRFAGRSEQLLDRPENWPRGVLTWEEWRGGRDDDESERPPRARARSGRISGAARVASTRRRRRSGGYGASPAVAATGDPTGAGIGIQWSSGAVHMAATLEFDHRLLGIAPRVGVRYRWIEGPRYSLDIWSTIGPSIWLRPFFAAGAGGELGLRNVFGTGPARWSAGVSLDSAVEFSPVFRGRYRPEAGLGIGFEREAPGLWPDAVWLRGQLGYDFVPSGLGAIHANMWLSTSWSFGWK